MKCPQCEAENRDGAKFCDECGCPLSVDIHDNNDIEQAVSDETEEDSACEESEDGAEAQDPDAREPESGSANRIPGLNIPRIDNLDASEGDKRSATIVIEDEDGRVHTQSSLYPGASAVMGASRTFAGSRRSTTPHVSSNEGERIMSGGTAAAARDSVADVVAWKVPATTTTRIDLTGFEECLADASYRPARPNWHMGDTLEMPAIPDSRSSQQRDFRAPDIHDKKALSAEKKKQKRDQRQHRKDQRSADRSAEMKAISGAHASRRRKTPIVIGVLAAFAVAAGAVAFVTYNAEVWGGRSVPDVTGLPVNDARFLLEGKGFGVRETGVASDEASGTVLMMDPGAGSRQDQGAEVVLHVATPKEMPSVVGKTEKEAKAVLAEKGFDSVVVKKKKSDKKSGVVLATSPKKKEKVKTGEKVVLTVSSPYTVPDVSGKSFDSASAAIEKAGFTCTEETVYKDDVDPGTVLGTEPKAGAAAKSKSLVTVQVARSRAQELEEAASSYLSSLGTVELEGTSFEISSVDSVSYSGNNTTDYTMTVVPFAELAGETVRGTAQQHSGSIVWGEDNSVQSMS